MGRRALLLVVFAALAALTDCECVKAPQVLLACERAADCPGASACVEGVCVAPGPSRGANDAGPAGAEGETGEGEGANVGGEGEGEGEGEGSIVAGEGEGASSSSEGEGSEGEGAEGEGEGAEGEGEGGVTSYASCLELHAAEPAAPTGTYALVVDGVSVEVECDMTTAGGGWGLLFRFAEGDACVGTWIAAPRGCGRGTLNDVGASFTPPYAFSEVRGFVHGLDGGGTDGFRDVGAGSIESQYFDGISLTVGQQPRRHLWSFAAGISDSFQGFPNSECPCAGGPAPLPFVGASYSCEGGTNTVAPDGVTRGFDTGGDALWDGLQVNDVGCVGAAESAPDFDVQLGALTTDAVELRIMVSQDPSDEDLALIGAELWVR